MLQTFEATFKDGQVYFDTPPKRTKKTAKLLVVFLDRPVRVSHHPHAVLDATIAKLQQKFAVSGRNLANELIAERRREAVHE